MVNELFKKLLSENPAYDLNFVGVKKYITKIRSNLFELLNAFHIDLIADDSGGIRLVSHVLKQIILKIDLIFKNYQNIIKTLIKTNNIKVWLECGRHRAPLRSFLYIYLYIITV